MKYIGTYVSAEILLTRECNFPQAQVTVDDISYPVLVRMVFLLPKTFKLLYSHSNDWEKSFE